MVLLHAWGLLTLAQEHDVEFSTAFIEAPFSEFASGIEAETGVRFYFIDKWVEGVTVTTEGATNSLHKVLAKVLIPNEISHYIDEYGNVFLTNDIHTVAVLPDYSELKSTSTFNSRANTTKGITSAEQRYIEGHKSGLLETLVIGEKNLSSSSSGTIIHGKMIDRETGEPLIGATVYVVDLKKGTATDVDGRFSMVLSPGKYRVAFNCMGMEPIENYLQINSGGSIVIPMDKGLISITEVVIKANKYDNVKGSQMGFERLNYKSIREIPAILGEKDLLKVALMLPGVQSVGEGSSGFNVRGGSADQNMIYVNKVPVYNSSHMFGFFTSFSPDIVKDFSLYKSNLPASYGGRLSSVFDISTRQGNMNKYTARGGISPITGHVAVEGPIVKDKSAFVLSARSSYSDWILKQLEDKDLRKSNAGFYDLAATITAEPNEKNLVKAFAYYSKDDFSLGSSNQYEYSNAGGSVNLRHRFNQKMSGDMALVFGQYGFSTINTELEGTEYSHDYRIDHYELKADMTWLSLGKHKLTYGVNAIYYDLHRGIVEPFGETSLRTAVDLGKEKGVEFAGYIGDEISLSSRLTLYAGLRYSAFINLGPDETLTYFEGAGRRSDYVLDTISFAPGQVIKSYSGPEPRLSLTYLTGQNSSVKFSYNRVQQYLFMLSNTVAISPTDQWKLSDYHLAPPKVNQVSMGYYLNFPGLGLNTSTEIYYKQLSNVVEYKDGANFITSPNIETQVLQGEQEAYGLEMMIRKNAGKLNGWLSYSYSKSNMLFNSAIPGENINSGLEYPSNYNRPHNINLVSTYKMNRRFSFSANMVYITGRPITYPISIYYIDGLEYIDYSSRNAYRIEDYFRVDLSANLEGNLKKRKMAHSFWMLSVYNLTGRKNAYSVYFRNESGIMNGYKLSIFGQPIVTLSWNFKFGNYASE